MKPATTATMSASSLCSLAADLASNQILRFALNLGAPVADTQLEFCGFTNRTTISRLARNTNCRLEHRRYSLAEVQRPLETMSPSELAQTAFPDTHGLFAFTVDGYEWVESGVCQCASQRSVQRFFLHGFRRWGRCPKCRMPIQAQPLHAHRTVAASLLGGANDRPLNELGVAQVRCVLVSRGEDAVLFRNPPAIPRKSVEQAATNLPANNGLLAGLRRAPSESGVSVSS